MFNEQQWKTTNGGRPVNVQGFHEIEKRGVNTPGIDEILTKDIVLFSFLFSLKSYNWSRTTFTSDIDQGFWPRGDMTKQLVAYES